MNKDKILAVADAIEKLAVNGNPIPGLGFNMAGWAAEVDEEGPQFIDRSKHGCGTTACIAGWTVALEARVTPAKLMNIGNIEIAEMAEQILGLDSYTATALFYSYGRNRNLEMEEITPEEAVAVLRNLAETGDVDWGKFTANHPTTQEEENSDYDFEE